MKWIYTAMYITLHVGGLSVMLSVCSRLYARCVSGSLYIPLTTSGRYAQAVTHGTLITFNRSVKGATQVRPASKANKRMSALFDIDQLKVSNTVLKHCRKCDAKKPHSVNRYWYSPKGRYRWVRQCLDCKREKQRKAYQENDKRKEQTKEAFKRFQESGKLDRYKGKYNEAARQRAVQIADQKKQQWYIDNQGAISAIYLIDCKECGCKQVRRTPYRDGAICGFCYIGLRASQMKERPAICKYCGVHHSHKRSNGPCANCVEQNEKESNAISRNRRKAIQKGVSIAEPVNKRKVFDRDRWRCKMCHIRVQDKTPLLDNSAELDHIVPLSKGGVHTYSNVRCLCRRCNNVVKSDKLIGQMVMQM
jgi:5-methylcytosine-specific restriction endonuclease McrA